MTDPLKAGDTIAYTLTPMDMSDIHERGHFMVAPDQVARPEARMTGDMGKVRNALENIVKGFHGVPVDTEACNYYAGVVQVYEGKIAEILAELDRIQAVSVTPAAEQVTQTGQQPVDVTQDNAAMDVPPRKPKLTDDEIMGMWRNAQHLSSGETATVLLFARGLCVDIISQLSAAYPVAQSKGVTEAGDISDSVRREYEELRRACMAMGGYHPDQRGPLHRAIQSVRLPSITYLLAMGVDNLMLALTQSAATARREGMEAADRAVCQAWQGLAKGTLPPVLTGDQFMAGAEKMAALATQAIRKTITEGDKG